MSRKNNNVDFTKWLQTLTNPNSKNKASTPQSISSLIKPEKKDTRTIGKKIESILIKGGGVKMM